MGFCWGKRKWPRRPLLRSWAEPFEYRLSEFGIVGRSRCIGRQFCEGKHDLVVDHRLDRLGGIHDRDAGSDARSNVQKLVADERVDCLIFDDEVKAEKCEISENLDRSDLTALERDQHVARWIELTEGAANASQVVTHKKRGQQPEGINAASRELGIGRMELGLEEIPAHIVTLSSLQRQIAECDENLCGPKLTSAEEAMFTARRKQAYVALHPETRNGATGRGRPKLPQDEEANPADRFTLDNCIKSSRRWYCGAGSLDGRITGSCVFPMLATAMVVASPVFG